MGLSGPRKRAKFSHNPNNTTWSRSQDKYGQRILQAHGWRPGDFLGAQNAPHAKHYTEANASHVRVFLRDDNLGLGARPGAAGGAWQTTGLNGFENLLGRLNGRSETELEKIQKARADVQRKLYAEQRWGGLNFVSGGLLVGDRMQENEQIPNQPLIPHGRSEPAQTGKTQTSTEAQHRPEMSTSQATAQSDDESTSQSSSSKDALRKAKAERRAARAERKVQKELRRQARQAKKLKSNNRSSIHVTSEDPSQNTDDTVISVVNDETLTEATIERPISSNSRHTSRHRNIRHKKLAMMDNRALNEILMIKG